jgi:hypothetical protein
MMNRPIRMGWIYLAVFAATALVILAIADLPPASWVGWLQAPFTGQAYCPQVTAALLLLIVLGVGAGGLFFVRWWREATVGPAEKINWGSASISGGEAFGYGLMALMGAPLFVAFVTDLLVKPTPPASWLNNLERDLFGATMPQLTAFVLLAVGIVPGAAVVAYYRACRLADEEQQRQDALRGTPPAFGVHVEVVGPEGTTEAVKSAHAEMEKKP